MSSPTATDYHKREMNDDSLEMYSKFFKYYDDMVIEGLTTDYTITSWELYADDVYLDRTCKEFFIRKLEALKEQWIANWRYNRYTRHGSKEWSRIIHLNITIERHVEEIEKFINL